MKHYQIKNLLYLFKEIEKVTSHNLISYPKVYTENNFVEVYVSLIQENLKNDLDVDIRDGIRYKRLLSCKALLAEKISINDPVKKSKHFRKTSKP